jgi:transposase
VSGFELTLEPQRRLRRIEVLNGAGDRRRWSPDDKARILEETPVPGAVVSEVARRHGLTPEQLFGWRREARGALNAAAEAPARFVPAVVEAPAPGSEAHLGCGRRRGPRGGRVQRGLSWRSTGSWFGSDPARARRRSRR